MAVDLSVGEWDEWLFYRHPDGQFVSLRKLSKPEVMQVEDQIEQGIILDAGQLESKSGGLRCG